MLNDYNDEQRYALLIDHLKQWIIKELNTIGVTIEVKDSILFNLCIMDIDTLKQDAGMTYLDKVLQPAGKNGSIENIGPRFKWLAANLEYMFDKKYILKIKELFETYLTYSNIPCTNTYEDIIAKHPYIWILPLLQLAHKDILHATQKG